MEKIKMSEQQERDPIVVIQGDQYRFNEMSEAAKQKLVVCQNLSNSIRITTDLVSASQATLEVYIADLVTVMPPRLDVPDPTPDAPVVFDD
jgi:hypothetical protein